jgi:hypothetical protein
MLAFSRFRSSHENMAGGTESKALARIDAALSRIEAAARSLRADADNSRARHAKLRASVEKSLGDLDALIAANQP